MSEEDIKNKNLVLISYLDSIINDYKIKAEYSTNDNDIKVIVVQETSGQKLVFFGTNPLYNYYNVDIYGDNIRDAKDTSVVIGNLIGNDIIYDWEVTGKDKKKETQKWQIIIKQFSNPRTIAYEDIRRISYQCTLQCVVNRIAYEGYKMERYINNRELIKNLAINTGTTLSPEYTTICTTSEVTVTTDLNEKDFYVFCDALQRKVITGASVMISGTLKLDVENEGDLAFLDKVHTLIGDGEITQFSNVGIQFDLLTGSTNGVLEYTTYQANVSLNLSDLGGAAEDESEFSFEMQLIGKATEVASA